MARPLNPAPLQALLTAGLLLLAACLPAAEAENEPDGFGGTPLAGSLHDPARAGLAGGQAAPATAVPAAAPTAPARRIAPPTPAPTPVPGVRPEELRQAEERLREELRKAALKAGETAEEQRRGAESLRRQLAEAEERLKALAPRLLELEGAQDKAARELRLLDERLSEAQSGLVAGLKKVDEVGEDMQRKGAKMTGLLDLVSTLKRDLNDNSHEIVGLKKDLEQLRDELRRPEAGGDWWEQAARWRYLPATAAVLSALALGVALTR